MEVSINGGSPLSLDGLFHGKSEQNIFSMDDLEVPMGTHLVRKPTYWLLTIQKYLQKKIEGLIRLIQNLCVVYYPYC